MTRLIAPLLPLLRTILVVFPCLLAGCIPQPQLATPAAKPSTPMVARSPIVEPTFASTLTPAPVPTEPFICNQDWQSLPIIPEVTESARELYQQGKMNGNDPRAFSKIGDGEISTAWFLTAFDLGEAEYDLGEYQTLKAVIESFRGSFGRNSLAAQRGFNSNLILDASASDPTLCNAGESPLGCELRIHNPSIAVLSLGTNQVHRPDDFEAGMRKILDVLVSRKILPILSTKGDNLEGDHRINRTIACLAQEYQIPLWNFWSAIQPLPDHGLQPDLEHLTYSGVNDFDDPVAMQSAWTVRNLTALQVLDAVWQAVK